MGTGSWEARAREFGSQKGRFAVGSAERVFYRPKRLGPRTRTAAPPSVFCRFPAANARFNVACFSMSSFRSRISSCSSLDAAEALALADARGIFSIRKKSAPEKKTH